MWHSASSASPRSVRNGERQSYHIGDAAGDLSDEGCRGDCANNQRQAHHPGRHSVPYHPHGPEEDCGEDAGATAFLRGSDGTTGDPAVGQEPPAKSVRNCQGDCRASVRENCWSHNRQASRGVAAVAAAGASDARTQKKNASDSVTSSSANTSRTSTTSFAQTRRDSHSTDPALVWP